MCLFVCVCDGLLVCLIDCFDRARACGCVCVCLCVCALFGCVDGLWLLCLLCV